LIGCSNKQHVIPAKSIQFGGRLCQVLYIRTGVDNLNGSCRTVSTNVERVSRVGCTWTSAMGGWRTCAGTCTE
jgi:hypothetical protein